MGKKTYLANLGGHLLFVGDIQMVTAIVKKNEGTDAEPKYVWEYSVIVKTNGNPLNLSSKSDDLNKVIEERESIVDLWDNFLTEKNDCSGSALKDLLGGFGSLPECGCEDQEVPPEVETEVEPQLDPIP